MAFDVPAGRADEALAAMRVLGIAGLSVTTPHKEQVADCVDGLAPAAAALRSVNTVVAEDDGRLVGHSTDGQGFVAALHADGVDVCGMHVAVLGAGAGGAQRRRRPRPRRGGRHRRAQPDAAARSPTSSPSRR